MADGNFEDSPFYVEYTGVKTSNIQFKHSASFKKALVKHLKSKYDSDSYGDCLRLVVEDYLQRQCLEQKLFQKTIVGITTKEQLKCGGAIKFLFVKDNYTQFFQNEVDKGFKNGVLFIQVNKSSVDEFIDNNLMSIKEMDKFRLALEQYADLHDVVICEIALNNWLDSYDNGVYGLKADKSLHLGVNILNTVNDSYGIIYRWGFATDISGNEFIKLYGSNVENYDNISIFDKKLVLRELNKYNKQQYVSFKQMFDSHDLAFPKNEVDKLFKEYERKLAERNNLDADIENIESKLKSFGYLD